MPNVNTSAFPPDKQNDYASSTATADYDGTQIIISIDGLTVSPTNIDDFGSANNPTVPSALVVVFTIPVGGSVLQNSNGNTLGQGTLIDASFNGVGYVLDTTEYSSYTFTLADLRTVYLDQTGDGNSWPDISVSSVGGGTGPVSVTTPSSGGGAICFFGNAPVLTPAGYRRMDSLRAGDKVATPGGREAAIEAVKIMRCAAGPETNPYVIPKGEFGATKKLLISPRHRVATAKGMVEAQHLGLAQEERTGTLTYYNLALPGWANMIVAGVEVESLAPVERITVPFATFKALLEKNYGSATPAVREMIRNTCRFLENGMVECPVMRR